MCAATYLTATACTKARTPAKTGNTWPIRHIPRVRIHPNNPDLVYAAVLGDLFKPGDERGVYRSKDGGQTWQNENPVRQRRRGRGELYLDPNNPRILLHASTWRIRRTPYSLESGGEGSPSGKAPTAATPWSNISANKGLPTGLWGISGVTVSPVNSNRVWAYHRK